MINNQVGETNIDGNVYRCKNCRLVLFKQYVHGESNCSSYFIDQPKWINTDDLEN